MNQPQINIAKAEDKNICDFFLFMCNVAKGLLFLLYCCSNTRGNQEGRNFFKADSSTPDQEGRDFFERGDYRSALAFFQVFTPTFSPSSQSTT
jgi:hypothetical protein